MNVIRVLAVGFFVAIPMVASAHGDSHATQSPATAKKEQKPWGIAGDAAAVKRTIDIKMLDKMRYEPDLIQVKQGETLKLVMTNTGAVLHEFVIGTKKELDEHAALMRKFPTMEHDEPFMTHVSPSKKGEIVWNFNRTGEFDFACLIPGHYEAGMVGKIKVTAR